MVAAGFCKEGQPASRSLKSKWLSEFSHFIGRHQGHQIFGDWKHEESITGGNSQASCIERTRGPGVCTSLGDKSVCSMVVVTQHTQQSSHLYLCMYTQRCKIFRLQYSTHSLNVCLSHAPTPTNRRKEKRQIFIIHWYSNFHLSKDIFVLFMFGCFFLPISIPSVSIFFSTHFSPFLVV